MRLTEKSETILRRAELAAGLALTLLLVYLHFSFMQSAGSLWRDEIHTFRLATMPSIADMWAAMSLDSFPAFTNVALRLWTGMGFGGDDPGLRIFGFLVGSLIIAALWLNGRLINRSVPLISLLLFAFSPLAIRVCDSIRPYGLGVLFITLTLGLVWKVVEAPDLKRTIAAGAAAVLSVQCLFTNAFLLFAICLAGIIVSLYSRAWKKAALVLGIGAAAAISLLPYAGIIRKSSEWVVLVEYPNTFALSWKILTQAALGSVDQLFSWLWLGIVVLGVLFTVYHVLRNAVSEQRDKLVFFTIAMTASMSVSFAALSSMEVMPTPWYFLPSMAITAVSVDALFGGGKFGIVRVALAVVVVAVFFNTALDKVETRQTNIDLIAEKMESMASKDDLILVSPWYFGITFQRHYNGEAQWMTIPPIEDLGTTRYDLLKKKMASRDPLRPVFSGIEDTLARGGKLWLVGDFFDFYSLRPGEVPMPMPPAPNGPYGWKSMPYLMNWSTQTEYLILSRELKPKRVTFKWESPVNPDEYGSVIMVDGERRD